LRLDAALAHQRGGTSPHGAGVSAQRQR
jgi:hypothetical protein